VVLYDRGSFKLVEHRYERQDLKDISNWWQNRMRTAVAELPSEWVESAFLRLGGASREAAARASKPDG
jgi:putative proteasome-type protease